MKNILTKLSISIIFTFIFIFILQFDTYGKIHEVQEEIVIDYVNAHKLN